MLCAGGGVAIVSGRAVALGLRHSPAWRGRPLRPDRSCGAAASAGVGQSLETAVSVD